MESASARVCDATDDQRAARIGCDAPRRRQSDARHLSHGQLRMGAEDRAEEPRALRLARRRARRRLPALPSLLSHANYLTAIKNLFLTCHSSLVTYHCL